MKSKERAGHERHGSAQAIGHDRGDQQQRGRARWLAVRHPRGRLSSDARLRPCLAESDLAIEGSNGIGRHIATRLVADDQEVIDGPPKFSARAWVFATGQGGKTDAADAHSVDLVGTRMAGLRPVVTDEQLEVLCLLVDRRRPLGEEHARKIRQLHRLLLEIRSGGAKQDLSAAQVHNLLARVFVRATYLARPASASRWTWWSIWRRSVPRPGTDPVYPLHQHWPARGLVLACRAGYLRPGHRAG